MRDRHVVVTGGTGALGRAVVEAFLEAGAVCHVPHRGAAPPAGACRPPSGCISSAASISPTRRRSAGFYAELPAVGLRARRRRLRGGAVARDAAGRLARPARSSTSSPPSSAAARPRAAWARGGRGGRIVNVASRAAVAPAPAARSPTPSRRRASWRSRARSPTSSSARRHPGQRRPPVDDRHAGQPRRRCRRRRSPRRRQRPWPKPRDIAGAIPGWLASDETASRLGEAVAVYGRGVSPHKQTQRITIR